MLSVLDFVNMQALSPFPLSYSLFLYSLRVARPLF
jgi:hypothetical protein